MSKPDNPVCEKCHETCEYLALVFRAGGTVGGTQLYGCPKCGRVYYIPKKGNE